MNWFRNLKLKMKLISSFAVVALIAGVIGGLVIQAYLQLMRTMKIFIPTELSPLENWEMQTAHFCR